MTQINLVIAVLILGWYFMVTGQSLVLYSRLHLVVYDPRVISYTDLLRVFWEGHDPTQGMRQGEDIGTQYRSGIYTANDAQTQAAETLRAVFQQALAGAGYGHITTEIEPAGPFYFAEERHQQYLAKNPEGDCGAGGTGVGCPE